jgi:hypothetical protein
MRWFKRFMSFSNQSSMQFRALRDRRLPIQYLARLDLYAAEVGKWTAEFARSLSDLHRRPAEGNRRAEKRSA